ncbi:hypothetical protein IFR04_001927 [Cadophora malorum]|uniref:Uncharacterized protein n=1 Tax=Cadophora malorum TaxID=108018 RepID=A0A8H8BUY8_9HELO|nr:hypothetical protein IFR04_001927 [Cadophora malorum]
MNIHIFIAQLATEIIFASTALAPKAERIRLRQDQEVPKGYTVAPLHVTGGVNGVAINHTGTIQDVFEQLDADDNSFKLSDFATI